MLFVTVSQPRKPSRNYVEPVTKWPKWLELSPHSKNGALEASLSQDWLGKIYYNLMDGWSLTWNTELRFYRSKSAQLRSSDCYKGRGNAKDRGKYINLCFIILGFACLIPVIIIASGSVYWHTRHHFLVECVFVKISGYVCVLALHTAHHHSSGAIFAPLTLIYLNIFKNTTVYDGQTKSINLLAGGPKKHGVCRDRRACTPHNTPVLYAPAGSEVHSGQRISMEGH